MPSSSQIRIPSRRLAAVLLGAVVLLFAACSTDEANGDSDPVAGEYSATASGFINEPAGEVGPDAFTAAVDTAPSGDSDSGGCDKAALLEELRGRPDAHREWAAVLGVAEGDVEAYIESLEPQVLGADTLVTNHGLHEGRRMRVLPVSQQVPQCSSIRTSRPTRSARAFPRRHHHRPRARRAAARSRTPVLRAPVAP